MALAQFLVILHWGGGIKSSLSITSDSPPQVAINCGSNKDTFYKALRTDTNVGVSFGVGSEGSNHGIWSHVLNKWMIHSDGKDIYISNRKIMVPVYFEQLSTYQSKSGSYEYTGVNWTAPEDGYYCLCAQTNWNYASAYQIGIHWDNNANYYVARSTNSAYGTPSVCWFGRLSAGEVRYFFTQKSGATSSATESIRLYGFYFPLNL